MLEPLLKSYKSVGAIIGYMTDDFSGAYTRFSNEYDINALILFWIQIAAAVLIGGELLFPVSETEDQQFSKVWFVFSGILEIISLFLSAATLYLLMRLSGFKDSFWRLFKFVLALGLIYQLVGLAFSFASDLYLYSVTDYFEAIKLGGNTDKILASRVVDFIGTYIINGLFALLLVSLFYFSVHKSKATILCLAVAAAMEAFVYQPQIDIVWESYTCKRLNVCRPVFSSSDLQKFDDSILKNNPSSP